VFYLTYCMKGIGYGDLLEMAPVERKWLVDRLYKQQLAERAEIDKARKK